MKKKFIISIVALAVAGGALLFNHLSNDSWASAAEASRDCSNNSIISCGATSASELLTSYSKNATGDLDDIYNHYGITASMMRSVGTAAKKGMVYRDGRVVLNGKTIATNAYSIGRRSINGSTKISINGKSYYERKTSVSFVTASSFPAFIFLDNSGNFKAAILTPCGNPVRATKPVYSCDSLSVKEITRTKYLFTSKATAKSGANIVSYNYDFGDDKIVNGSKYASVEHTYKEPGTYNVTMTVNMKVNGSTEVVKSSKCAVKVVVKEAPSAACNKLTPSKLSRTVYRFTTDATMKNGAKFDHYLYQFGDGSKPLETKEAVIEHDFKEAGTYKVKVSVIAYIDGVKATIDDDDCEIVIKIEEAPKPPVYTCDSLNFELVGKNEYRFDSKATVLHGPTIVKYVYDFDDGSEPLVTKDSSVTHKFKPGTYNIRMGVIVSVDGKEKTVIGDNCNKTITIAEEPAHTTCDVLTKEQLSRTSYKFKGAATVKNATIEGYKFVITGDNLNDTIEGASDELTYDFKKEGTYKVKLSVKMKIGEKESYVTAEPCEQTITIAPEPVAPSYSCDLIQIKKESKFVYIFNGLATAEGGAKIVSYTVDFGDGDSDTVKTLKDLKHTYKESGEYKVKLSVNALVNDTNEVITSEKCKQTIKITEDKKDVITELPKTGSSNLFGGLFGISSLVLVTTYYVISRRNLLSTLLNR